MPRGKFWSDFWLWGFFAFAFFMVTKITSGILPTAFLVFCTFLISLFFAFQGKFISSFLAMGIITIVPILLTRTALASMSLGTYIFISILYGLIYASFDL